MKALIDWEQIPQAEYERYLKRLRIVELILDESIDPLTKKKLRRQGWCSYPAAALRACADC
jgi:hypothetical protein